MKRKLILIVTVVLTTLTIWSLRAGVNPHIVEVDLDIDYLAADDPTEWTPGGFVCVEGRRKITLQKVQPADWGTTAGDSTKRVRLSWGSTKIAIYDAATGGNAVISGTDYANANLPTNFWVEGVAVSATAGTSTAQGPETILAQAIPDGMYDRISFTVVDFTKLMLTDAVTDENVADTTLFDELQSQDNTLYVAEASNGTAELTIQGWWQPDDIDGDQFRWKVLLTNEANEATATTTHWAPDNNGTFTMNPQTLTWTSNTVSGLPDRTFKILGWYDCNGNGVYDSDEPHRLLNVSVYNFQIVWAQRNSPWKVADYTAAQSVQQPLGGQVGQPGGEGGFGGAPTGSEFGRLSDPFTVKNYELIDNGSGSSRTLKLKMLSNVSSWSNDYVLTEQGVNSDIFADEEDGLAVRRVLEQNVADSAKGPDRETVLMASVAFGAERIMTVYKPQNGSVYEAERVTVEIEMSALPATNVADTITVTVVSSLRPGLVETGVLVETSVDSLVFARSDGELKMQIVRITDKDTTGADDLTAVLSSKALEISGSTVDAMETGAKSLVFRTDAISASGGAAGTGGGASSYVAIGAIWVPLGAIAKDKVGQPTFPRYWQGTTLRAQVTRRRGMILEDYPNDLEWSKAAEQLPPAGASTDCKYYTFAPLKIFHVIDDDGATPVFSDVLPFLPIIPGLPALPSVTRVKAKGGDILKAKPVGHAEPYDEVTVFEVDIDSVDANFAPSVEKLAVRYTIKPAGYTASFGKLEVFKNGDTVNPIFKDETITMTGANVLYEWDGKANQGADSGKYVGPRDSPYTIKVSISDVADFSSSCSDSKTTKVEVESLAFNINRWGEIVIMNVPEHQVEVSTLVKLKKKDGTGAVTAVPIHVSFSGGDPEPWNATPIQSYSYATGKYLGKKGDPTAIYWADHASADSGSTDGYKHVCWGATITTAGADQGKTYVWFRPSGVGGDDFILKAVIKDSAGADLITKESGLLTVWRQAAFEKIFEMAGETHVSVNGTEVNIQPYFHNAGLVETYVDYVVGAVKPIPIEKSVQYICLWKNAYPHQKDWATLRKTTALETIRADVLAAAEGPAGVARDEARARINDQAQFWVDRIDSEFNTSMMEWLANGGMANDSIVGIKYIHPKYNSVLVGGVLNPDTETYIWPDWVRVTTRNGRYTNIDPDSVWCPGTGFGGLSHPNKIISITKNNNTPALSIAHEVGHATKSFFKRRNFSTSLSPDDHSALGLMDPSGSQPAFTVDEQKILRGIKP